MGAKEKPASDASGLLAEHSLPLQPAGVARQPLPVVLPVPIGCGSFAPSTQTPPPKDLMRAGCWSYPAGRKEEAAMSDVHKVGMILLMLWMAAAATMTLANAQEPAMSEVERRGLAACLIKCPNGDAKCNNRCLSQFQTRGAWSDRARACIRACRNGFQGSTQQAADGILGCSVNCVP